MNYRFSRRTRYLLTVFPLYGMGHRHQQAVSVLRDFLPPRQMGRMDRWLGANFSAALWLFPRGDLADESKAIDELTIWVAVTSVGGTLSPFSVPSLESALG